MAKEPSTTRLKIEISLLMIFLVGYLSLVWRLSTYECFEPNPTIHYAACNIDYLASKLWAVVTLSP